MFDVIHCSIWELSVAGSKLLLLRNNKSYIAVFLSKAAKSFHTDILGNLSKDVFERRTSTGSEVFSLLICLDANKFVLLSFSSLIKTIYPRFSTEPLPNDAKSPLPVDVRRSKTLLLKLPNVESHEKLWIDVSSVVFDVGGGGWACVVHKRATNEIFPPDFCPRLYRSRSIDFRCFWNSAVELLL